MQTVYSLEEPPSSYRKSIFLAGPTPRNTDVQSWRPQALRILENLGYNGVVFIPENRNGIGKTYEYGLYPKWEHRMLDMADCIVFWIPRDLKKLPGFTTNVEFGLYAKSGKCILGAPPEAKNISYLKIVASKHSLPCFTTLEETIQHGLSRLGSGSLRIGGEREVPLMIWRLWAFQNWYQAQKAAGNKLNSIKIDWVSSVRNQPNAIFACALRPNIYVASENRNKFNDPVIIRLDISTILLYYPAANWLDTEVVITKEFRLAASTNDGFIYELPGGSSPHLSDPLTIAAEELREEVGLSLSEHRFKSHGLRQLAGTLSAHKAHLFSVKLKKSELDWLKSQRGIPRGVDLDNETGERTYVEIWTLREILSRNLLDWSNVGMILSVLNSN